MKKPHNEVIFIRRVGCQHTSGVSQWQAMSKNFVENKAAVPARILISTPCQVDQ